LSGDPGARWTTWRRSALVRRLLAADVVNRGMLFAAVLLLCFVPFLIDLQSLAGRRQASGFVRRFGLLLTVLAGC
jgi:hypothetical protein